MTNRSLTLLLSLLLLAPLAAQQSTNRTVNARAELSRKVITIGDQINLEVYISAPPGTEVAGVDGSAIEAGAGAEIISGQDLRTVAREPELLFEQRFVITSFDTGYVAIAGLPVYFRNPEGVADTTYTNDLLLTVRGAPVAPEDDILPIKPIMAEPRNWVDYWPVYLGLLLVAAGFGLREYRRRQTAVAPPPPPPPPPDQRALTALDELEARQLWQNGRTKDYYSELTRILRTYLEGRFGIPALELTTRQITTELGRRRELDPAGRQNLAELLQLSDLVKFARATPAEELHRTGLRRVREFVRATGAVATAAAPVTDLKSEEE